MCQRQHDRLQRRGHHGVQRRADIAQQRPGHPRHRHRNGAVGHQRRAERVAAGHQRRLGRAAGCDWCDRVGSHGDLAGNVGSERLHRQSERRRGSRILRSECRRDGGLRRDGAGKPSITDRAHRLKPGRMLYRPTLTGGMPRWGAPSVAASDPTPVQAPSRDRPQRGLNLAMPPSPRNLRSATGSLLPGSYHTCRRRPTA